MDCNQRARVQSAYLVAAVGNPERLYRDVRQMGIEVRGTGFFPDHYRLKPRDWRACKKGAHSQSADVIIITEKDAIKLEQPPDFPVYVAVQSTEILDAWKLERALRDTIEERV
jgi:tetraacyldisaccharide-1-P 4'-kinase